MRAVTSERVTPRHSVDIPLGRQLNDADHLEQSRLDELNNVVLLTTQNSN
jgi:hypothetical protein